ncbi:glycoporin [Pragia fontium]|uniref:Glycoporin n=1 Tax=Pragia fontium TaxID=82985 RepID=A0ABQ5LHN6_9GAMM|nr:glycoporin [Pragia fontium]
MRLNIISLGFCCLFSTPLLAGIAFTTPQGSLKLSGDVEFNMDGASTANQLTSVKSSPEKNKKPGDKERWDINGRILIGFDGYRGLDNGNFAGFTVQPLADLSGQMNLDDAAFFFGQEKMWQIKLGRFEAYDMFPLSQDTFIEYSGNTANDLYADGYGYIYMMKEGRGRSSNGGNAQINGHLDKWYFEINALIEDGTRLFVDQQYHGQKITNEKNVVYLRPIIAWKGDSVSTAVGMETNIVSNAYGYKDENQRWHDESKRTGYGLSSSWKSDNYQSSSAQGTIANINLAYLDAQGETNLTGGANVLWNKFELGYIYAHNKISERTALNNYQHQHNLMNLQGKYKIHTIHTSYLIPNVLDMDNFNIYLGAYWSRLERISTNLSQNDKSNDDRYGARVRFKYLF